MIRDLLDALLSRPRVLKLWLWVTSSFSVKRRKGAIAPPFIQKQASPRFLILRYHRVNDVRHPFFPATPVKDFQTQMEILNRHFNVLSLEELVMRAREGDVPPNSAAVTFDDGYRDNYEHAFPILRQMGIPATVFLVTGAVETNGLIWHDRVFEMFRCTPTSSFVYEGNELSLRSRREKEIALDRCLSHLKRCSPDERDSRIDDLETALRARGFLEHHDDKLTWNQVKTMAEASIEFGAHTVTHPILSHVSLDTARQEIVESKRTIEAKLGRSIRLFAYPNGRSEDFNETCKELVASAGFDGAVTTIFGVNVAGQDPFELRRVGMWGDQHHVMAARLALTRMM